MITRATLPALRMRHCTAKGVRGEPQEGGLIIRREKR